MSSLSNGKVFPSGEGRYVPASSFISRSDSTRMRFGGIPSFLRFAEFVQKSVEPVQLAATATKDETVPGGDKAERRGKKRNAYRASCNRVGCAALPQRCFFFLSCFLLGRCLCPAGGQSGVLLPLPAPRRRPFARLVAMQSGILLPLSALRRRPHEICGFGTR